MRKSPGFTIVELLVVIAIIGLLVALVMPAIQAAREASRQANCQNNLKQIGTGVQQHVSTLGYYPTGGWAPDQVAPNPGSGGWVGDPDMGTGPHQPGGWIYNLLPYIDQQPLHDLGAGAPTTNNTGGVNQAGGFTTPSRQGANAFRMMSPLSLFNCASRRRAMLFPLCYGYPSMTGPTIPPTAASPILPVTLNPATVTLPTFTPLPGNPAQQLTGVAKSDFAINRGDGSLEPGGCEPNSGPTVGLGQMASTIPQSLLTAKPLQGFFKTPTNFAAIYTGVSFQQSLVQPAHITDGANYTFLVGEKGMNADHYLDGSDFADQHNMYSGFCADNFRCTAVPPVQDMPGYLANGSPCGFGSPHPNGTSFLFCDSHVQIIRYGINPVLFASLGHRNDTTQANSPPPNAWQGWPAIDDTMLK